MSAKDFQSQFLRLIALTWLLPPMVGFAFLIYIEIFSLDQLLPMMTNPLEMVLVIGGFTLAIIYFRHFSQPLSDYLKQGDKHKQAKAEQTLKKFSLHFWLAFSIYIILAPGATIISLEMSTDYIARPVDWFRVHLVALIVSIIVGLPIFIRIYDLFGKAFGNIHLQGPILTIKTRVFLVGALIPLLIDTMLVQYYWTRTGFFSVETFFIWLLLECLAIAGALLFVRSFTQSLEPLNSLIDIPAGNQHSHICAASTDELGIFARQLSTLLDEQQLHQVRLEFSNELLKSSYSHEGLAKLLQTITDRTCQALKGDICFLSLYDKNREKLICVVHTDESYNPDGHFQISLDETSIQADAFNTAKTRIMDDVQNNPRSHKKFKKMYNILSSAAVPLTAGNKILGVLQIAHTRQIHEYSDHEIKILQAFAQEATLIQLFFEDIKHRRKAETAISKITKAVSTAIGADFFNAITLHMAEILQADSCGVVATRPNSTETVETLAYFFEGKITDNIQYPLKNTPCETIIDQQIQTYADNLQQSFPENVHIREAGMEAYVGIPLFDSHERPLGLLFAMFKKPIDDISFNESVMHIFAARTAAEIERLQTEERIKHMAYSDDLTQLPNRAYLMDRLQQEISLCQRNDTRLTIIMLDLDHFKKINDSLGHLIGDGLLIEVSRRLQNCIRKEDTVARLGGDEFIMLLSGFTSRESTISHVSTIAEQINQTLKKHYLVDKHNLMITSSCGIAIYPDDGQSAEQLIKHADTALYKAKETGRDGFRFFSSEMNIAAMERLEMESAIQQAIEEKQFEVAYQPKVSIKDNHIIGAEILLRWHHPTRGYIPPERFIPIADETGQIIQLGEYIFQQACIQTSDLWCSTQCCNEIYSLSVNVSPRQFQQDNFIEKIQQTLEQNNTNPCCIELEITENILIDDAQKASEKLQILKDMGLKISIDDFGTGYASLRYLQQLPIGMIKIDRSFITHISSNPNDLSIVKTIITMADNLGIKTIAEGVETNEQLQILQQLGCEFYQGFLFSKAVSKDEFRAMIMAQRQETS